MSPEKDYLDVDLGYLVPHSGTPSGVDLRNVALPDVVARGKLFIQNADGTFTQIECASYWKEDNLLTVCANGTECDDNGDVTRRWE